MFQSNLKSGRKVRPGVPKKTVPEKEEPVLFVLKFFISELRLPVSSDLLHPDLPDLKIELVPDNPLLF